MKEEEERGGLSPYGSRLFLCRCLSRKQNMIRSAPHVRGKLEASWIFSKYLFFNISQQNLLKIKC